MVMSNFSGQHIVEFKHSMTNFFVCEAIAQFDEQLGDHALVIWARFVGANPYESPLLGFLDPLHFHDRYAITAAGLGDPTDLSAELGE